MARYSVNNYTVETLLSTPEEMLMCGKVTHMNLIGSSPLFQNMKNLIEK